MPTLEKNFSVNFRRALVANIEVLGLTASEMHEDALLPLSTLYTYHPKRAGLPDQLKATDIQRSVPHHPRLDLPPDATSRNNLILLDAAGLLMKTNVASTCAAALVPLCGATRRTRRAGCRACVPGEVELALAREERREAYQWGCVGMCGRERAGAVGKEWASLWLWIVTVITYVSG